MMLTTLDDKSHKSAVRGTVWMAGFSLVALATLAGCEKKAGGQVVAVVNSEEVTQQELRAEAEANGAAAGTDFQKIAPAMLDRVIQRNLLADYARKQGLDRGPDFVARRRQLEQSLLATLALKKLAGTPTTPTPADVQRFIADNPTLFAGRTKLTLDQVGFPTPADPKQIKALAALGSVSAVETKLKADGIPSKRGNAVLDTGTVDPAVSLQMTKLANGALFDLSTNGVTYISTIVDRAPVATAPDTWTAPATEALRRQRMGKSVSDAIANLRKSAKIDYDAAYKPVTTK
jgi:peptidyl-prolyl cis-trans isomerase C